MSGHGGFAPIKDKTKIDEYQNYQHIVHRVAGGKRRDFDSYRLFIGWRLTDSKKSLFKIKTRIADQAIIQIPSGQEPPMYPKLDNLLPLIYL